MPAVCSAARFLPSPLPLPLPFPAMRFSVSRALLFVLRGGFGGESTLVPCPEATTHALVVPSAPSAVITIAATTVRLVASNPRDVCSREQCSEATFSTSDGSSQGAAHRPSSGRWPHTIWDVQKEEMCPRRQAGKTMLRTSGVTRSNLIRTHRISSKTIKCCKLKYC